jgi:hypothetical protein
MTPVIFLDVYFDFQLTWYLTVSPYPSQWPSTKSSDFRENSCSVYFFYFIPCTKCKFHCLYSIGLLSLSLIFFQLESILSMCVCTVAAFLWSCIPCTPLFIIHCIRQVVPQSPMPEVIPVLIDNFYIYFNCISAWSQCVNT